MKPKLLITESVVNRLKTQKSPCIGRLYGTLDKNQLLILGLFNYDENDSGNLYFPGDIDMCGVFQIGPMKLEQVHSLLNDVDVTDNPIFLSLPESEEISASFIISDKLETAALRIIKDDETYANITHVRVKAQIPFCAELESDAIKEELLAIRKQISSGKIAFHCPNENVFILGSSKGDLKGTDAEKKDITVKDITEQQSEEQYTRTSSSLDVITVIMYKNATTEKNETEKNHCPVIRMQKTETKYLQLMLKVDALALVRNDVPLHKIFGVLVESVCRNVRLLGRFLLDYIEDNNISQKFDIEVIHYFPKECGHFVSRAINRTDLEKENIRVQLHTNFLLPKTKPMFRKANRFVFKDDLTINPNPPLINPHLSSKSSNNGGMQALVKGDYEYYHYCQNNMDDDGWGCAYRSLQTLASWFKLQGYADQAVPTYKEMQQCLHDIGDKPANFVGSRQWIGSTEVNYVLNTLLGVDCKILHVSSGEEMASKGPELVDHFITQGTPIMIGGGVLAHTILGVDYNRDTGNLQFLILDPHYKGTEDIKTIVNKGWCGWKGVNFWDKKAYYNMCMPIKPSGCV